MTYTIQRAQQPPAPGSVWEDPVWTSAETAAIDQARPESSDHRPRTQVRLLYDDQALHGIFRVEDRYVRCVHTAFQDPVCRDSCVEFFFKPHVGDGYMNLEFNCGGAFLSSYIRDWTRIGEAGFRDFTLMHAAQAAAVSVWSSMPRTVVPERVEPTVWILRFRLPFSRPHLRK